MDRPRFPPNRSGRSSAEMCWKQRFNSFLFSCGDIMSIFSATPFGRRGRTCHQKVWIQEGALQTNTASNNCTSICLQYFSMSSLTAGLSSNAVIGSIRSAIATVTPFIHGQDDIVSVLCNKQAGCERESHESHYHIQTNLLTDFFPL